MLFYFELGPVTPTAKLFKITLHDLPRWLVAGSKVDLQIRRA